MSSFVETKTKKADKRPAQKGWASGSYICHCICCKCRFMGNKKAFVCADCAYKERK